MELIQADCSIAQILRLVNEDHDAAVKTSLDHSN